MKHANLYPFDLCTPLDILWWDIRERRWRAARHSSPGQEPLELVRLGPVDESGQGSTHSTVHLYQKRPLCRYLAGQTLR